MIDHHHLHAYDGSTTRFVLSNPDLVAGAVQTRQDPAAPFTIVLHEAPDFDSVASAYLAIALLSTGAFPPGAEALARYADKIDEGSIGHTLVYYPDPGFYAETLGPSQVASRSTRCNSLRCPTAGSSASLPDSIGFDQFRVQQRPARVDRRPSGHGGSELLTICAVHRHYDTVDFMPRRLAFLAFCGLVAAISSTAQRGIQPVRPPEKYPAVLARLEAMTVLPVTQWRTHADMPHGEDPSLDDSAWTKVTLSGGRGGGEGKTGSRGTMAWYRATFTVPETAGGKDLHGARLKLMPRFSNDGRVFVNGGLVAQGEGRTLDPILLTNQAAPGQKFVDRRQGAVPCGHGTISRRADSGGVLRTAPTPAPSAARFRRPKCCSTARPRQRRNIRASWTTP